MRCIKCPNCGSCIEEYGEYPYHYESKEKIVCDAKCSGCGQHFKLVIREVERR